jgi:hypothetical protein
MPPAFKALSRDAGYQIHTSLGVVKTEIPPWPGVDPAILGSTPVPACMGSCWRRRVDTRVKPAQGDAKVAFGSIDAI